MGVPLGASQWRIVQGRPSTVTVTGVTVLPGSYSPEESPCSLQSSCSPLWGESPVLVRKAGWGRHVIQILLCDLCSTVESVSIPSNVLEAVRMDTAFYHVIYTPPSQYTCLEIH